LPEFLAVAGANRVGILDYPVSPSLIAHGEVRVIFEVPLSLYQKALLFLPRSYFAPLISLVCLTTQQHIFKHSSTENGPFFEKILHLQGKFARISPEARYCFLRSPVLLPPKPGTASSEARYIRTLTTGLRGKRDDAIEPSLKARYLASSKGPSKPSMRG
jgi:hypothetical protein